MEENENKTNTETQEESLDSLKQELAKARRLLDKANGEAKTYKDQLRAKQTESEQAEAERVERQKAMEEELATLRKANIVANYKSSLLGLGFDETLSNDTANAIAEGNTEKIFANLKAQQDKRDAILRAEILANGKNNPPSGSGNTPSKDELNELSDEEYYKLKG